MAERGKVAMCIVAGLAALLILVLWGPDLLRNLWAVDVGEIDVRSGRYRFRQYAGVFVIDESVSETEFSRMARETGLARTPLDWRTTHRYCHGLLRIRRDLHEDYSMGRAASACQALGLHLLEEPDVETRRAAVAQYLKWMQQAKIEEMQRDLEDRIAD